MVNAAVETDKMMVEIIVEVVSKMLFWILFPLCNFVLYFVPEYLGFVVQ
jgi:hypothetical protein